ncbi:MAG: GNAT family N-acetyltransferase [Halobacteriovoraceae bacterium]|nr:GNAT family N-acetyltransferase [Halobacteriovoraceae bacterium]
MSLKLVRNDPFNVELLKQLFGNSQDIQLLWPEAKIPFARDEWSEKFNLNPDNISLLFQLGGKNIGHVALIRDPLKRLKICFVYLDPSYRGSGFAHEMLRKTESWVKKSKLADTLFLTVRTYNPKAFSLYTKNRFQKLYQEGTAVLMSKDIK